MSASDPFIAAKLSIKSSIAERWVSFAAATLPLDASTGQRRDMRAAFHAGFFEAFRITVALPALTQDEAVELLLHLDEEIRAYFRSIG